MKVFIHKGNEAQMEKCNSAQEALAAIAEALDDNLQHVSVEIDVSKSEKSAEAGQESVSYSTT